MGLSRNKVAVPEGAAGTPPFWRIRKGFLTQLDRSASEGQVNQGTPPFWRGRLSSSEELRVKSEEFSSALRKQKVWIGSPKASLLRMFIKIEEDEAERRDADSLKPVL